MAPTLVLVPGSFGSSEMYDPVVLPLRQRGYDIHVLDPPCYPRGYKKGAPAPSMYDDARFISEYITGIADKTGNNVVLLAHSYGGTPASESLEHVTAFKRSAQGKKGGVVRIAYITAVVPQVGGSPATTLNAGSFPPLEADEGGWLSQTDFSKTAALCFNSLTPEAGTAYATENFGRHSSICFADTLTYPGYKDIPVSWFFCGDDKCVTPEIQQSAIDEIEASWKGTKREGEKVSVTRVECDHVPILSARDELEKWIEGLFGNGELCKSLRNF
ncbi:Alpha/Beta hydrolase protein [Phaeosphaeriaceae sp. PMI808]|nr:Alpha/Beta hydrolase protein [Phaeosphaeriaceae sp. PMI808]